MATRESLKLMLAAADPGVDGIKGSLAALRSDVCFHCGQRGHFARNSPPTFVTGVTRMSDGGRQEAWVASSSEGGVGGGVKLQFVQKKDSFAVLDDISRPSEDKLHPDGAHEK